MVVSDYIAVAELAAEVKGAEPVKNLWEQGVWVQNLRSCTQFRFNGVSNITKLQP